MKILFILQDAPVIYGAEQATLDLLRGLSRQTGMSCEVILVHELRLEHYDSPLQAPLTALAVPVHVIRVSHPFSLSLVRQMQKICNALCPDIIHTTGYKMDIHAMFLRRGNSRLVSTVHGWLHRKDRKERFYSWLNRLALKHFDTVVTLSSFYDVLLRNHGIPTHRIPTGIDCSNIPEYPPKASSEMTVGCLGRLSEEKNQRLLIDAMSRLKDSSIQALISGTGPDRPLLEKWIAASGLTTRVTLAGYMDRETFFQRIDVLVLCSSIENLPLVIMEAMLRGIPVIASHVGGVPDLIEHGVNGLLFPANDAAALVQAIDRLDENASLRNALGKNGQRTIINHFSYEHWIQHHTAFYENLCRE